MFFSTLLDLVYPPRCLLCGKTAPRLPKNSCLCPPCQSLLKPNRPPFCRRCSQPLNDPERPLCSSCDQGAGHFDRAWGVLVYNDELKKLIHLFKYGRKTALRHDFGQQLLSFAGAYPVGLTDIDLIVPVPLHPSRRRERGFNQSELLAETLSRNYSIPLSASNLRRERPTPNQARLKRKQRWTNLEGAFRIKHPEEFSEKNILIVDDLFTTGATSSEMARILKEAGANSVTVLTLAIAADA